MLKRIPALTAVIFSMFFVACGSPIRNVSTRTPDNKVEPVDAQHARLIVSNSQITQYLLCLDGKEQRTKKSVLLEPGRHYIRTLMETAVLGYRNLWFDAEPGRIYQIQSENITQWNGYSVFRTWIIDHATGATVGGLQDGAPPTANDPPRCKE